MKLFFVNTLIFVVLVILVYLLRYIDEDYVLVVLFLIGVLAYAIAVSVEASINQTWYDPLPSIESPQPQDMMD